MLYSNIKLVKCNRTWGSDHLERFLVLQGVAEPDLVLCEDPDKVLVSLRQVLDLQLLHAGRHSPDLHPHLAAGVPHGDLVDLESGAAVGVGRAPLHREGVGADGRDLEWRSGRAGHASVGLQHHLLRHVGVAGPHLVLRAHPEVVLRLLLEVFHREDPAGGLHGLHPLPGLQGGQPLLDDVSEEVDAAGVGGRAPLQGDRPTGHIFHRHARHTR